MPIPKKRTNNPDNDFDKARASVPEKYSHIDFKPPAGVAKEAELGLEWRKEYGRGGTSVGVQRAVQLKNRQNVSPDIARRMYNFFNRHEKNRDSMKDNGEPGNGKIAWKLWGGDAGRSWANKLWKQMKAADDKASAMATAISIIKEYCSKANADLWQSIINENPTVVIPKALKERGIDLKDGKVKMNDLLVQAESDVEIDEGMGNSKHAKGKSPEELLNRNTEDMRRDTAVKEIEKNISDSINVEESLNNPKETAQDLKELIAMLS